MTDTSAAATRTGGKRGPAARTPSCTSPSATGRWSAVGLGSVIGSGWLLASIYAAQDGRTCLAPRLGDRRRADAARGDRLRRARHGQAGVRRAGPIPAATPTAGWTAGIVGRSMWISYVGNPPPRRPASCSTRRLPRRGLRRDDPDRRGASSCRRPHGRVRRPELVRRRGSSPIQHDRHRDQDPDPDDDRGAPDRQRVRLRQPHRPRRHAPYGWSAALGTIATAGMVFAYTGFRNVVELSGEARNPAGPSRGR